MVISEYTGYFCLVGACGYLGLYKQAGYFCQGMSFVSWYLLGLIVLKKELYIGEIGVWGTGCIMRGLFGFPFSGDYGWDQVKKIEKHQQDHGL